MSVVVVVVAAPAVVPAVDHDLVVVVFDNDADTQRPEAGALVILLAVVAVELSDIQTVELADPM